jgi:hypothetical protein
VGGIRTLEVFPSDLATRSPAQEEVVVNVIEGRVLTQNVFEDLSRHAMRVEEAP